MSELWPDETPREAAADDAARDGRTPADPSLSTYRLGSERHGAGSELASDGLAGAPADVADGSDDVPRNSAGDADRTGAPVQNDAAESEIVEVAADRLTDHADNHPDNHPDDPSDEHAEGTDDGDVDAPAYEPTGEPAVDEVLEHLSDLDGVSPADQVAQYDAIHRRLHDILTGAAPTGRAPDDSGA